MSLHQESLMNANLWRCALEESECDPKISFFKSNLYDLLWKAKM
jgi:hypothetical protein